MRFREVIHTCCQPIYAEFLRPRVVALAFAAVGAAQVFSSMYLGVGLPCMFHAMTGIPCPGCGLTRSITALLHGHVKESVLLHPFGPLILAALVLAFWAAVMPGKARNRVIGAIASAETKTGFVVVGAVLLMLVWSLRVLHLLPLTDLR